MKKQSTVKKPRRITLRFRKNDPYHNLLAAVQHYVSANGGEAVVIGGVEIQRWPDEPTFNYRLAVKCTGTAPKQAEASR